MIKKSKKLGLVLVVATMTLIGAQTAFASTQINTTNTNMLSVVNNTIVNVKNPKVVVNASVTKTVELKNFNLSSALVSK